jgi:hypothetical protein
VSIRRRILVVHACLLVVGAGVLLAVAVPLYWDGLGALDPGALSWTVPAALVVGAVGGALEGLLLGLWQPAGWVVAAFACLLGLYVPGVFASSFSWVPSSQQVTASSGLATALLGWAMFMVVLTGIASALRRRDGAAGIPG